ncbi:MAG: hypothetical protein EBX52_09645 [Proteobacteria bacterium]|nr:hypothetical protein [Pseudomonadota bacterium]
MQDASYSASVISTARLNDLIESIQQARRSLDEWQNQKTEAMIRLDSFSFDIQKIEEDRNRLAEQLEAVKREFSNEAKIYQGQITELTDQLQLLKFELEAVKGQSTEKDLAIESLNKELANRDRTRAQLIAQQQKNTAEMEALFEKRQQELLAGEKKVQEGLAAQLSDANQRRVEAEARNERLERDLANIRTRMIGILHPDSAEHSKTGPRPDAGIDTHHIQSMSKSETSVDDYLKRLGY